MTYVWLASNSKIKILYRFVLLTRVDVKVDEVLHEPWFIWEEIDATLDKFNSIHCILLLDIDLIDILVSIDNFFAESISLSVLAIHTLQSSDSFLITLCLVSKTTCVINTCVETRITKQFSQLLWVVLHHLHFWDIAVRHEHIISSRRIIVLICGETSNNQWLELEILYNLRQDALWSTGIVFRFALLVISWNKSHLVCLGPIVQRLLYSSTPCRNIYMLANLALEVTVLKLFVTNETSHVPCIGLILSLIVLQCLCNSSTCTSVVRGLSICQTTSFANISFLSEAASAYQHESCKKN